MEQVVVSLTVGSGVGVILTDAVDSVEVVVSVEDVVGTVEVVISVEDVVGTV